VQILINRIIQDGLAVSTEILKVDSFLNHQVDVTLFDLIGAEFRTRFDDVADKVDKILTIEASGIAVAAFTAKYFGSVPVVFAKKDKPTTMTDGYYFAEVMSFTKQTMSAIRVDRKFLKAGERCLIIDDFLAHGQAALGLVHIAAEAGAEILGAGIVIEKEFQKGGEKLRRKGVRVESLAVVEKIENGEIFFKV